MSTQSSASPALEPLLLRTDSQGIVTLRLNRPGQFNALSEALLAALQAQIDALAGDAPALRGAGSQRPRLQRRA